jgi:hypothetical protein
MLNLSANFNHHTGYQQGRLDLVDSYRDSISKTLPSLALNYLGHGPRMKMWWVPLRGWRKANILKYHSHCRGTAA